MQKSQQEKLDTQLSENLTLTNRKQIKLDGIIEIISTSDTSISLKLKNSPLTITGTNINITKLDIELGILEASGNFETIKYTKSGGLFKKIFKWKLLIFFN